MDLSPLFWTLILLAISISFFLTATTRAKTRLKKQYPPIGQMIDIGGYRLHMHVEWEGTSRILYPIFHRVGRICIYRSHATDPNIVCVEDSEWTLSVISTCSLFIHRYAQIFEVYQSG